MAFFRRKSKEEDLEELKDIVERTTAPKLPEIEEEPKKEETNAEGIETPGGKNVEEEFQTTPTTTPASTQEQPKSTYAPLFVKIEKYRNVLDHISDLKTTTIMLKNALIIQKQIEGLRDENRKFLELAISKIDKKIVSLDAEFLRPKGFEEEFPEATYETEGLEGVVDDLKKQIEGLKSELKTIS